MLMDEKKSYPYLRALLRCSLGTAAIISTATILLVVLVIWPMNSWLFVKIFGRGLSGVLIGVGLLIAFFSAYSATMPRHVPAYLSSRKMMYYYQKTGSGIRLFNRMLRYGTDAEPMACLFVAGIFMILEGVAVSVIWG